MNRRDAVKLAAGLTVVACGPDVRGQEPKKAADPVPAKPPKDAMLDQARKYPEIFFFGEPVTFKTSTTEPRTFNLVITSALNEQGIRESVEIRPGTIRIFRADSDVDDATKKGGVHWTCGMSNGTVQLKHPGELVLAVREQDGTVRLYSLALDVRC